MVSPPFCSVFSLSCSSVWIAAWCRSGLLWGRFFLLWFAWGLGSVAFSVAFPQMSRSSRPSKINNLTWLLPESWSSPEALIKAFSWRLNLPYWRGPMSVLCCIVLNKMCNGYTAAPSLASSIHWECKICGTFFFSLTVKSICVLPPTRRAVIYTSWANGVHVSCYSWGR